mmetsp:Transcript_18361/g.25806  ORF Transcript_18361/g.25806 Transcript_18361/m.25806 type:complete len:110 (+) Transcript_18361:1049-1378(+)
MLNSVAVKSNNQKDEQDENGFQSEDLDSKHAKRNFTVEREDKRNREINQKESVRSSISNSYNMPGTLRMLSVQRMSSMDPPSVGMKFTSNSKIPAIHQDRKNALGTCHT